MKEWYQQTKEEILSQFQVTEQGLTSSQAEKILAEKGENVLEEGKRKSTLQVFLEQFCDLLVVILIIAALISMVSGNVESTVVILAVIILNAILGTVQHAKAEKSLDSLKSLSSPNAKVLRDGQKVEIPSAKVVPGDILYLEAGDLVVADGRILENYSLQVNESSLTGESTNVDKSDGTLHSDCALADRANMVYSSGLVTYGRAVVLVTATGMDTEIGKIAALMNATKEKKTPLQVSLDQFGSRLAMAIMVICALVFLLSLYRKMPVLDSLMFAVALAVAAIPEALSSIVTIVQAMGTQKMAKEHAIIKELKAVESLGCVSVICSDKTGTLTQNKMTVEQYYVNETVIPADKIDVKDSEQEKLMYFSILCNDSSNVDGVEIGDPTETALINLGSKLGLDIQKIRGEYPRESENPFDSDRKLMSTKHTIDETPIMVVKGAVDVIMGRTASIQFGNEVRVITAEDKEKIEAQNQSFSRQGLRVLGFAYKAVSAEEELCLEDENNLTFLGLIAMMDPPREESMAAVAECKRAGIRPIMITGDHKVTAAAIAKRIGILEDESEACEGAVIDSMSDEELKNFVEGISVYARVSPEHKIRIVRAWQEKGNIVAMTGDGVNDAPALKQADIGVAMGITGSEVSKDAASMVLTDDNFATIVKAVENGRNVYQNIKNSIQFLLSGNFGAILAVLYASIAGLPVPFAPVHLLFINLLTDSLPAIALGLEPHSKKVMDEKPRPMNESILTKDFLTKIGTEGLCIGITTMIGFMIGLTGEGGNAVLASTMAFGTLCTARLVHGFNCKSDYPVIFSKRFWNNIYLIGAFLLGLVLITCVMTIPALDEVFKVQTLTFTQLLIVYGLALVNLPIIQLMKKIKLMFRKNK